ncbi:EamA-like transporter family protein [Maribacter sedimenticola]|uniref:EamA-like transporter family protein n=1 Tax=Maribacter sedimenticola TaxID=228956 RepID=A0ABY1SKB1_9FLAO|nr:DMT family transporter [Maribacter sedimenticola]SNR69469.1 EamA-like transporter family protein [Maribacter sedimenticola]
MPKDRLQNLLHLHFIVFIWGFTAILGKLITIDSLPLVWSRMGLATLFISLYIYFSKFNIKVSKKTFVWLLLGGIVVALHWVTFFLAIKVSTVSVALAMMSTGAFFTALMEPFWYKRKIITYEIFFGLLVIIGLYLIFKVETQYMYGMVIALISAFLAAVFSLINGKLVQTHKPSVISFYELGIGVVFLSVVLLIKGDLNMSLVQLTSMDWVYLLILAIICTAYAFIASVKIMRVLTPYTVMLTTNLEPVYGILLAWFIFGTEEEMKPMFYVGACIILLTVIANGILKQRANIKKRVPKI